MRTIFRKVWTIGVEYLVTFRTHVGAHFVFLGSIGAATFAVRAWRRRPSGLFELALAGAWGAGLVGAYAVVSAYMVDVRYLYPLTPLVVLMSGIAVAAIVRFLSQRGESAASWILLATCIVAVYAKTAPDVNAVHMRYSPTSLAWSNFSGHKEMGAELLAARPELAGLRVVTRKLFGAYHLKAADSVPYPQTEHLGNPDADLLIADSRILEQYRPQFLMLAFGQYDPPPGRVVYSRLFPEYHRVITVYDLRQQAEPMPDAATLEERLSRAAAAFQDRDLCLAWRECEAALAEHPRDLSITRLMERIDEWSLEVTGRRWSDPMNAEPHGEE